MTASNICTSQPKGKGICSGDSGGPAVTNNGTQIGVVSFGGSGPCSKGLPGVCTSVIYFLDWIKEKTKIEI